ncbi:MerR family transcriptional regulator [Castellaniella sp. GW247-6E4]|uniref:MerR family transcriptional regulator n=1 Tax=Castellaniella sp. GW247-6E4 TaxID=3140380 RepID=UPI003315DC5E
MNIGRIAKLAGVNVETIRYYQRRGLIDEPAKPLGSHRRYPPGTVQRIRFIKRAQALGFSLDEIIVLLQPQGANGCAQVRELVQAKIRSLDAQIDDLAKRMRALQDLIDRCREIADCADCAGCPLREHLSCEGAWGGGGVWTARALKVAEATGLE